MSVLFRARFLFTTCFSLALVSISSFDLIVCSSFTSHLVYQLVMLHEHGLNSTGAVCLDGSDSSFFIAQGSSISSWQIHLQGGGWCYTIEDCWARSFTALGSSKFMHRIANQKTASDRANYFLQLTEAGGIMSASCAINPSFCEFNKVIIPYCDGFSFAGDRSEVITFRGKPLFF